MFETRVMILWVIIVTKAHPIIGNWLFSSRLRFPTSDESRAPAEFSHCPRQVQIWKLWCLITVARRNSHMNISRSH